MHFLSKFRKVACNIHTLYVKLHIIQTSKTRLVTETHGDTLTLILLDKFKGLVHSYSYCHTLSCAEFQQKLK